MKAKRVLLELIETILSSVTILLILYMSIALPEMVYGSSMEPNFYSGERIIVERVTKLFKKDFERGEVIVFRPEDTSRHLIKRVVGIPGDIFKVYDCKIYISRDDSKYVLDEYYLNADTCTSGGASAKEGRSFKVEEDEYVLLGDNREVSMDSRTFGAVQKNRIVGRVVFRFWPISKIGFVK